MPHRVVGEAAFFQRAEIRDVLAWLRLLADPSDAPAVVRALARPPIDLRSVDIARCTQIARRRKLDMVAALAAATESPQVPPEARERIRVFLKLYRAGAAAIDTTRPDLYVHRLIDRLGLRRQQLFAAQADVVERLRALARLGRARGGVRAPLAAGDAARVRALDRRRRRLRAARAGGARARRRRATCRWWRSMRPARSRPSTCYVLGLHAGLAAPEPEAIPDALLRRGAPGRHRGGTAPDAARRCCTSRLHPRSRPAGARVSERERPRRAAAAARRWSSGPGRRSAPSGRSARRSCSARPRRCTRPTGCCATSCSSRRCAWAGGSASCASTPTSTCPMRSSATSSCSSSRR